MDLAYTEKERAFRADVRAWMTAHVPKEPLASMDTREGFEQHRQWERTLHGGRWSMITWPGSVGGRDANLIEWLIFEEEYYRANAPTRVNQNGVFLLGPTLMEYGTPEQKARFLTRMAAGDDIWAQAWSEPNAGSDMAAIRTKAIRDGDHYVINGTKRYVSNGSMAKLYFVVARTDTRKTLREGGSIFIVPSDTPGFRAGFFHEKSSQRLATNGTFHFENCSVPAANMLVGEGLLGRLRSEFMWGSKAEAAATALGVGRAAYEYALSYAKKRVQGGKPIVEQQAVAMMLGTMAMKLDAARLQIWKAAWLADRKQPEARPLGLLAKVNASETAFECARLAGEILGGASIMHEHPVEKYLRDASSFLHSDGTNQVCLLRASQAIAGQDAAALYGF